MGLGDILEFLIPAFIIYQFLKGFAQNKKKTAKGEGTLERDATNAKKPQEKPAQPENLNDIFQALFSDEGFSKTTDSSKSTSAATKPDADTAHILGGSVDAPLDEVDLDAPSKRRDSVQFDHNKTRYEKEFARKNEFIPSGDTPLTADGHNYFEEEFDADLFDARHGFRTHSSSDSASHRSEKHSSGDSLIDGLFSQPQSLQKAIVMKEVLDKPVSLRNR